MLKELQLNELYNFLEIGYMKIRCLSENHTSILCYPYSEGVSEAIVKPLFLVKMNSMSVKQEESISKSWDSVNYLETHERNVVVFFK